MRVTNQYTDAVDCFQDVFLEVVSDSQKGEIRDWGAYLRWLTTRRAIDTVRRRHRKHSASVLKDSHAIADPSNDLQAIEFEDLVQRVREELVHLSPAQAEAFWLVCVEQCTQSEVAESMQIERNHVGVLVYRARQHLQQQLKHLAPESFFKQAEDSQ
ncbi:RNA polymerase sigma factor [Stieleria varia]|uniref:RNA polymerase sigma factor n=2 Tax=Stieleria varia TaxID=2528005 RepID=A0A5C5ZWV7_9BACT|nr:RNA polymerase sigma factor [Stieleria varia]